MELYCGIDLGKRKSDFCIINEHRSILAERKLDNNLNEILEFLSRYGDGIHCVVESSATWYWLVDGLSGAGHQVDLAHTLGMAMIRGAKVKTDRRDARILAEMLLGGFIPKAYVSPKEIRYVRDLSRYRMDLVSKRAEEYVRIHLLTSRMGLKALSRNELQAMTRDELLDPLEGLPIYRPIEQSLDRIELISKQIEEVENDIIHKIGDADTFKRLMKIPGIGKTLAVTVYLETGEIERFKNIKAYSSYCRVVPGIAQSGSIVRRGRGSKQGNPFLKNAFTQAAVAAVMHYPRIKSSFDDHLSKHQGRAGKMVCYNAIAHKLVIAAFQSFSGNDFDMNKLFPEK